jgi:formylmethanofuran dehydrogenase subunit E
MKSNVIRISERLFEREVEKEVTRSRSARKHLCCDNCGEKLIARYRMYCSGATRQP